MACRGRKRRLCNPRRFLSALICSVLFFSFSAFGESLHRAGHNAYFHCKHTHRKVERTKNCPCGCNKKKRAAQRLTAGDDNCESDDVVAQLPQFAKNAARFTAVIPLSPSHLARGMYTPQRILFSIAIEPPVPPG